MNKETLVDSFGKYLRSIYWPPWVERFLVEYILLSVERGFVLLAVHGDLPATACHVKTGNKNRMSIISMLSGNLQPGFVVVLDIFFKG